MLRCGICLAIGCLVLFSSARAQENLDKAKTAAQLYASDCAKCHKSPQSVSKTAVALGLEGFLREHYAATPESAAKIAAYLAGLENRSAESKHGRAIKRISHAQPPKPSPSESKDAESPVDTVQRALQRLLQAIKPENN